MAAKADARGIRVTGTEIVGLVPRKALIDAGEYFLRKQQRSLGIPDSEKIRIAIKSMGLDELKPFVAEEKIVEDVLVAREPHTPQLIDMSAKTFAETTASEAPAPGGGSVAAYMGALAAALATMVANLAAHKAGWDDRWEEFSDMAVRGQKHMNTLLTLVDRDTEAFNGIMAAFGMPKATDAEKAARSRAIHDATVNAVEVPYATLREALATFSVLREVALNGNPASASDAGVGALAARAAVHGAYLNMKINAADIDDENVNELINKAASMVSDADRFESEILAIVNDKIASK